MSYKMKTFASSPNQTRPVKCLMCREGRLKVSFTKIKFFNGILYGERICKVFFTEKSIGRSFIQGIFGRSSI